MLWRFGFTCRFYTFVAFQDIVHRSGLIMASKLQQFVQRLLFRNFWFPVSIRVKGPSSLDWTMSCGDFVLGSLSLLSVNGTSLTWWSSVRILENGELMFLTM
jgi:hypothetical protein